MSIETTPPPKTLLDADKVIYREKCIVLNVYIQKKSLKNCSAKFPGKKLKKRKSQ